MAYTQVSDDYKSMIKSNAVVGTARIKVKGETNYIGSDILQELTLKDCCYNDSDGTLIGTAMAKEVEITLLNKDKNIDLSDKEFSLELGLVLDTDSEKREFIPIGNFIVDSYEDLKSNNQYKLVAYDYMTKLNETYKVDESLYPCTLKQFYYNLCNQYGVGYVEQTLPNENFMINIATAPYLENMTGRAVLSACAQLFGRFAKVNRNNQIEMRLKSEIPFCPRDDLYPSDTLYPHNVKEVIDGYSMNSKLSLNKKYGPVNVVSLELGNVEGENVVKQDDESIKANGETTIRIVDNPFVYTEALREKAIDELFDAVKGFEYTPIEFNYKGRAYLDTGDIITVEDVSTGEMAETIYLNGTIKVPQLRQSTISSKALTNTAIKQKYITKTKQANTRTEWIVNKHDQQISGIISSQGDTVEKVNELTMTVEELNSKISEKADVTKTAEGYGSVVIDDINKSEPIYVKIRPTSVSITEMYPRNDLYPSDTLFPSFKRQIEFRRKDDKGNIVEVIPYDLPANLYWYSSDVYDEFTLDYENQKCYITRRLSYNPETDTLTPLAVEQTENYDYPSIILEDGDYEVVMPTYETAYMYLRLMAKNQYTTQFVTKVEQNSAIKQASDDINLSVDKKLTNYQTTTQTTAAIDVKANSILNTVSETYSTKTDLQNKADELGIDISNAEKNAVTTSDSNTDEKLKSYATTELLETTKSEIKQETDNITSTVEKTYATKTEMTNAQNEAVSTADSNTDEKLKNYSTTTNTENLISQAKSEIKQTTDSISSEVSKKVGDDEIISRINQSAEGIEIKGDRLNITGKEVNFKTNITKNYGTFTDSDVQRVSDIIIGKIYPTDEDYDKYDFDNNHRITTSDLSYVSEAKEANKDIIFTGSYTMNPESTKEFIKITGKDNLWDTSERVRVLMGLISSYFRNLQTNEISIIDDNSEKVTKLSRTEMIIEDRRVVSSEVIFNNDDGQTGTISLSKNVSNYDFIQILYGYSNKNSIIVSTTATTASLMGNDIFDDGSRRVSEYMNKKIKISGRTITPDKSIYYKVSTLNDIFGANTTEYIKIFKVVGIK